MNRSLHITKIENDYCGSNAYVVAAPVSGCAVVIDPSDFGSGNVAEQIARSGYKELLVLLSHEHFDHMSGVNRLRERFRTTVVALEATSRKISDPRLNLSRYSIGTDIQCDHADIAWRSGDFGFIWRDMEISVLATPGHSEGSICISLGNCLFSGDTLLYSIPTVTKLPGGDRTELRNSVDVLLERFPAETQVYPGHGPTFRMGEIDSSMVLGTPLQASA